MANWNIYHNPRCGKSRRSLELLRNYELEPDIVKYLKTPPSASEIQTLLMKLGISAAELLRTKEKAMRELNLDTHAEKAVNQAMTEHPILIERPIVVRGDRAVLVRPPENVEILM